MPTALRDRSRGPASLFVAFLLSLVALTATAPGATAAPAKLVKAFGGPVTGTCSPDAVAANTQAGRYQDFCVAFRSENDEGPAGKDLKSQVIDTPKGFAGDPDGNAQCTNAQFNVDGPANAACPGASQIGSVSSKIRAQISQAAQNNPFVVLGLQGAGQYSGAGIVTLAPTGVVYNLEHSGNEVARLGIDLRPTASILNIDQPNVKIIVRVTLRPSPDVGLRSIIETLPNTADVAFNGISPDEADRPLAVDEFSLTFFGPQRNGMQAPFAANGTDCSNTQATQVRAVDELGGNSVADSATYKLTECDSPNVQFKPSAEYTTTENRPDVTTETQVAVRFGASTQAGYQRGSVKRVVTTLPEGLSFSGQIASGPNGLPLCTAEQFGQNRAETNACPAATQVGTVSFKSPLLSQRLTGGAYLGPQPATGELPDLYIQAELGSAADAPRVKLVGKLTLDANNRIVATLDDLPEVPVDEFFLTFRGGDQAAIVTPPTCGTYTGALSAFAFARPSTAVDSTQTYTVNADCEAVGAFAPAVGFALDNAASAGKSSPFTAAVTRPDRSPRIARTQIDLPAGMLATLKGVPECGAADAAAGTCPVATKVGSVTSLAGVGPAPFKAPGEVFLTARQEGAVAGLVLRVPVVFGGVDLGLLNVPARIEIRPADLGLRFIADVPERFKGIPLNLRSITVRLDRQGFPLSPTSCGPLTTVSKITGTNGAIVDVPAGFQVSGCDQLPFSPQIDSAVNGATGKGGRPTVQVRVQNAAGSGALKQAIVTLPNGLGFDVVQTPRSCPVDDFKASKCADVAKIGKVSGALAITDEPLTGDLYLLKPLPGKTLPGLGLAFKGRFAGNVAGTNAVDAKTGQLITAFEAIPDLPLTTFQIDVTGGTGGVLAASDKLCSQPSLDVNAKFVAHSGPTVTRSSSTFCGAKLGALSPRITAKLGGVRKGRPTLVFSATAPTGSNLKFKQIDVSFPSGYAVSTSRAKSKKGLSVKNLSLKGKSTSKRISARKLRVKLPTAGSTKAKILTRSGTVAIKSTKKRKSKAKVAITLTFTYTDGKKTSVPIRLTPR